MEMQKFIAKTSSYTYTVIHRIHIVLYFVSMSKGQGFVLSEYLKSSLKKCEKSLSDIKYEISTVRHRTYLMKISHIGSSRR